MRYSEAKTGRTFVIRLEDGEILHETVEQFAKEHGVTAAKLMVVGVLIKGVVWLLARAKAVPQLLILWRLLLKMPVK